MPINSTRAAEIMNSPVHLTEEERTEAQEMIRKGELPPDALERQAESEARNVFGADARRRTRTANLSNRVSALRATSP